MPERSCKRAPSKVRLFIEPLPRDCWKNQSKAILRERFFLTPSNDRQKIEQTKLKMQGYTATEPIVDTSETGPITRFEQGLSLTKISLTEFERRIKKLAYSDNSQCITPRQMVESFSDNPALLSDILNESSLLSKIITNKIFVKKEQ